MRKLHFASAAIIGLPLMSCGVVPSLEQAAGSEKPAILISQIVERVKCELSDAFDERILSEEWLRNWTAKVDLTLQINDQAGVSPSGSYTTYQKNAFNFAAGSTSLTTTTIQAVNQSFTLSLGGGYSEQRQRAETISFAVSLREMAAWRRGDNLIVEKGSLPWPGDTPHCDSIQPELRGYLGLKEWIDSALNPVELGQLHAGIHPDPVSTPPKPAATPPVKSAAAVTPTVDIKYALSEVEKFITRSAAAEKAAAASEDAVATSSKAIHTAKGQNIDPFLDILTPELKRTVTIDMDTLSKATAKVQADAMEAKAAASEIAAIKKEIVADIAQNKTDFPEDRVKLAENDAKNADKFTLNAKAQQDGVKKIEDQLTKFKPNPPIDGLLHSVQFVVAYNASVTPNWSLLVWKGPGLTLPGASLSGTRTHILNIALGSPAEQARLIQNITIANTGPR